MILKLFYEIKIYAALVYRCSKLIYQLKTEIKITISFRGIHIKTKRYKTGYIDEVSVSFKTIYRHANLHSANKFLLIILESNITISFRMTLIVKMLFLRKYFFKHIKGCTCTSLNKIMRRCYLYIYSSNSINDTILITYKKKKTTQVTLHLTILVTEFFFVIFLYFDGS